MENYNLSDLAAVTGGNGFGGNSAWVLILLFLVIAGGNGFGNSSAASQEILSGQKFDTLSRQINQTANGIADSTFALNNTINGVQTNLGGAISDLKYDNAMQNANTQSMIHQEAEATRAMLQQNKIDALQAKVNELSNQLTMCGVPKINPYMYGISPINGCGCNNI